MVYEGYGPGGVAVYIEALTDNKNRTVGDIRHILTKHGGNLGASGCVSYLFEKKGVVSFDRARVDADRLLEVARITSYNVCYTKLLRLPVFGASGRTCAAPGP